MGAQNALRKKRDGLKESLDQEFHSKIQKVLKNTDPANQENAVKALETEKMANIQKIDDETEHLAVRIRCPPSLELDIASKKLALREKHLKELARAIKIGSSEKDDLLEAAQKEAEDAAHKSKISRLEIIKKADEKLANEKEARLAEFRNLQATKEKSRGEKKKKKKKKKKK